MIENSLIHPKETKQEVSYTLTKSSRKFVETTFPTTFNSSSLRKNYAIQ